MKDDKIINFDPNRQINIKENGERKSCFHKKIYVVPKYRYLECQNCGQVIDPFDRWMEIAQQERSFDFEKQSLQRQLEALNHDRELLKKQVNNLKQQVKYWENKKEGEN